MGYYRAGFDEIVGIDINPQPRYPFAFIQTDALRFLQLYGNQFDAIHASPPCQAFTKYKNARPDLPDKYPNLIPATREGLIGYLSVIENVQGAPLLNPIVLCGSMFQLDVRRHRLFETSIPMKTPNCNHSIWEPNRFPGGRSRERGHARILCRGTVEVGRWNIPLSTQKRAMGIDWMKLEELSEAIPPTYTEYIGTRLLEELNETNLSHDGS